MQRFIVNGNFFKCHKVIGKFTVLQITFPATKIKKARFQHKNVFKEIETTIYIFSKIGMLSLSVAESLDCHLLYSSNFNSSNREIIYFSLSTGKIFNIIFKGARGLSFFSPSTYMFFAPTDHILYHNFLSTIQHI